MTTIGDVARRAGVSTMTVSRVINGKGNVNAELRRRVESAVAELGYVGNSLPSSLRFRETRMLALAISDITNPFFTSMARGVEDTALEQNYSVIVCNTDESETKQERYVRALVRRQVDGFLLVPASDTSESVGLLVSQRVPTVLLDRRIDGCPLDVVRGNSEQGAHDLVALLIALGHRRIAALLGPLRVPTAAERLAGYLRALAEAGIAPDEGLVFCGQYSQASGYEMARSAASVWPRPTALLASNNSIAIGAYKALRAAGCRVPEDVAIASHDDMEIGPTIIPFFTVAAVSANEMGRVATRLLLERIAGSGPEGPQDIVLPAEVIVRESSGGPVGEGARG